MPKKTKMIGRDFQQFAGTVGSFYAPLYGTPAAEIARQINEKLTQPLQFTVTEDEANAYLESEELDNGDYRVKLSTHDLVPEEALRESGMDSFVNEKLDALEEEIRTGNYPEGSIRRVMVDHMIFGLKSLQRREMFADNLSNPEYGRVPGSGIDSKFVELGIIPKIAQTTINEKGEETLTFPKDFAEDNPMAFFIPRVDQEQAKYTMEQFQQAADKINLKGYTRAFKSYHESFREMQNLGVSQPATPEQEETVRNNVLTHIRELRQELQKARQADPEDITIWPIYKDKPGQMNNALYADRGFGTDIEQLNRLEDYLRSGLPMSGYEEYQDMRQKAYDTITKLNVLRENTLGTEGLVSAGNTLWEKMNQFPEPGAGEAERQKWMAGVSQAMESFCKECEKHSAESLRFKEGVNKSQIAQIQRDLKQLTSENKNAFIGYREDLKRFGQKYPAQRREQLNTLMSDMSDDMSNMAKEAKGLARKGKVTGSLRTAVDQVVEAGTKNRSPEEFLGAMQQLREAAQKAGHKELADWSRDSAAYYSNRLRQGKSMGMLGDMPLDHQRKAVSRGNESRIDHAMLLFNEKRSAVFGKGKESPEHQALREAAEKLKEQRQKLEQLRGKIGADKSELEKAEKAYAEQAGVVGESAAAYIKAKKSPKTPAGKQRLAGATLLYQEAMTARAQYRMREAAREHYNELGRQTQELNRRIGPDPARTNEAAEKNKIAMQKVVADPEKIRKQYRQKVQQQLINAKQTVQEKPAQKTASKDDITMQSEKRPKLERPARKPVSFDDMDKRFGPAKTEKKAVPKHKSKAAVKAKGKESEMEIDSPELMGGKE